MFIKKKSQTEPSLDFLTRDFDERDWFSNDFRMSEIIHFNFPKTLDRIDQNLNLEDVSDEKLLAVIRNSLKESKQICKTRNRIKTNVSRNRKHFYYNHGSVGTCLASKIHSSDQHRNLWKYGDGKDRIPEMIIVQC